MQVENNTVVSFHCIVTDGDGGRVDSSRTRGEPLHALIGHGGLVAGLEKALIGRSAGEHFEVDVAPEEAYGLRRDAHFQRVPKKYFRDGERLRPGMTTVLEIKEGGQRMVTVHKVGSSIIDVDLNHPLAGKTLHFDVAIVAVREAQAEEIAHGHVHGPHGHAHA